MFAENLSNNNEKYFQINEKENQSPLSSGKASEWGPLFKAIFKADQEQLDDLLFKGANPNIKNEVSVN